MSHRTFWQSHKCPTSPVPFLDISVTWRWKRKQPKAKRSIRILDQEFDGSTVLDKFRQRTHLCEARASAFPGQHCAVGQILVSLAHEGQRYTLGDDACNIFSLSLLRLGKKPLFPPSLQHTKKLGTNVLKGFMFDS